MIEKFSVSVVMPVYNAATYVETAVESIIHQSAVIELLLIEDGSKDNGWEICQRLALQYPLKIILLQHPGGMNKGAGASRNLGIRHASAPFIAFLDADDIALPNRFDKASLLFTTHSDIDGLYEPIGTHFYSEEAREQFARRRKINPNQANNFITGLKKSFPPEQLTAIMLNSNHGLPSTDGITLKKALIEKAGGFDERLRLHQDTHLWIKCSYHGTLICGSTDVPVALRGVHLENRISSANYESQALFYQSLYEYFKNSPLDIWLRLALYRRIVQFAPGRDKSSGSKKRMDDIKYALRYSKWLLGI